MSEVFVVCNQLGQYWGKKKKWVDGRDPKRVMTARHEDEAVNQLVELSARDIDLRGEVHRVATSERGVPLVEPSEHLIDEEPESTPRSGEVETGTAPGETSLAEKDTSAGATPDEAAGTGT